jgi:hypothetical protein
MAQLIPATPIQGSTAEQIRLFNLLKRLPTTTLSSQRLPAARAGAGFLLIAETRALRAGRVGGDAAGRAAGAAAGSVWRKPRRARLRRSG